MIKEETLNNIIVRPLISINNNDESKVKGGKLFSNPYNTTFICAKRKSGKTSTLAHILQKTSDKKTVFWIFCPTTKVDTSWISLIKILEEKGNVVNVFDSIMDGKINLLNEIINDLSNPEPVEVKTDKPAPLIIKIKIEEDVKQKKEYKPKKIAPKHIFVFDDISNELKNVAVSTLLKKSRHFQSAVYVSSQYANDLQPMSIKQLDYFLCFKSFSRDKLEHIHRLLDLSIDLNQFYNIYDFCFENSKGYDFLYIDVRNQLYRKNFNKAIVMD